MGTNKEKSLPQSKSVKHFNFTGTIVVKSQSENEKSFDADVQQLMAKMLDFCKAQVQAISVTPEKSVTPPVLSQATLASSEKTDPRDRSASSRRSPFQLKPKDQIRTVFSSKKSNRHEGRRWTRTVKKAFRQRGRDRRKSSSRDRWKSPVAGRDKMTTPVASPHRNRDKAPTPFASRDISSSSGEEEEIFLPSILASRDEDAVAGRSRSFTKSSGNKKKPFSVRLSASTIMKRQKGNSAEKCGSYLLEVSTRIALKKLSEKEAENSKKSSRDKDDEDHSDDGSKRTSDKVGVSAFKKWVTPDNVANSSGTQRNSVDSKGNQSSANVERLKDSVCEKVTSLERQPNCFTTLMEEGGDATKFRNIRKSVNFDPEISLDTKSHKPKAAILQCTCNESGDNLLFTKNESLKTQIIRTLKDLSHGTPVKLPWKPPSPCQKPARKIFNKFNQNFENLQQNYSGCSGPLAEESTMKSIASIYLAPLHSDYSKILPPRPLTSTEDDLQRLENTVDGEYKTKEVPKIWNYL